jgi:hypothetical protein
MSWGIMRNRVVPRLGTCGWAGSTVGPQRLAELRRCRRGASMKLLEEAMHPGLIGPAGVRLTLQ